MVGAQTGSGRGGGPLPGSGDVVNLLSAPALGRSGEGEALTGPMRARSLAALLACMAMAGCASSKALEEQRRRLDEEHQARIEALDRIEARLVQAVGVTNFWHELGRRHGEVTEIACSNAEVHAGAMARHHDRVAARMRQLTRLAQANAQEQEAAAGTQHGL